MDVVFESVTKRFRNRTSVLDLFRDRNGGVIALRDVSLTAEHGKVLAVLGPNGSGKSTLLKLIATILLPDHGRVLVGGKDTSKHAEAVLRHVSLAVTGTRSFYARLTARENLEFFAVLEQLPTDSRSRRISECLQITGLEPLANRLVHTFSAGMYQRLGIARALLKSPGVLLLDEPSNSLDPSTATEFWAWVRSNAGFGTTIILATHNFEEAVCTADNLLILREGSIAATAAMGPAMKVEELRKFYRNQTEIAGNKPELSWVMHANAH